MDFHEIFADLPPLRDSQAVIIEFLYYKDELDELHQLDHKLDQAIKEKGVGFYDGHEINLDMSDGRLYMYGPSAEVLFKAVKPILEATDFTRTAVAYLRFGDPGSNAPEIEVEIGR